MVLIEARIRFLDGTLEWNSEVDLLMSTETKFIALIVDSPQSDGSNKISRRDTISIKIFFYSDFFKTAPWSLRA